MAYGSRSRPKIPANSALIFDVEIIAVNGQGVPKQEEEEKVQEEKIVEEKKPEIDTTKFQVTVTQEGSGYKLKKGDMVLAHYRGTLLDGTKFDASYDRGKPLDFLVGAGRVIKCWDEGFIGLAKGAKADLICPPDYAYGKQKMGPIPANSPLLFSIEVVDIQAAEPEPEPQPEVKFTVTVARPGDGAAVIQKGDKV